jgi:hypothetical protein
MLYVKHFALLFVILLVVGVLNNCGGVFAAIVGVDLRVDPRSETMVVLCRAATEGCPYNKVFFDMCDCVVFLEII